MMTLNWKSTVMWTAVSLLFLLLALMVGPAPALADGISPSVGIVLYEVTEDMYLLDAKGKPTSALPQAVRRSAVATLSGFAKVGSPLCPWEVLALTPGATSCTVNASGADDISLATGLGSVSGTFAVVVQDNNTVDAPEFVVMTGSFGGSMDFRQAFAANVPLGYLTGGQAFADVGGNSVPVFTFGGTFRLPFGLTTKGGHAKPKRNRAAYYLDDTYQPVPVRAHEKSLGFPAVRLEITVQ